MENNESQAMAEIREIRKTMSEQMKSMTDKEIVDYIKEKSLNVEMKYKLNLPQIQKLVK